MRQAKNSSPLGNRRIGGTSKCRFRLKLKIFVGLCPQQMAMVLSYF